MFILSQMFTTDYPTFKIACLLIASLILYLIVKHLIKLRNYAQTVPSKTVEFQYLLQFFIQFIFKPNSEFNGYSLMAHVFQNLMGMCFLFKKESLFSFWISYFQLIFITKPEAVEEVLSGTKMLKKGWMYSFTHCWLGTGLLTSHGEKWRTRRKLLTPAFHFDILKDFVPIINEKSTQLVKKLEKETGKDYVDITKIIALCSLDIICETTLGVNINAQENSESEYIKAVSRSTDCISKRMLNVLHWFDFTFFLTPTGKSFKKDLKLLHEFTRKVIQEKKADMLSKTSESTGNHKRKPLIEVLLEHHIKTKDLSEEDIREEVDTFTFEGHDTTATALTWTLYLLGLYTDVQEKVYEELYEIFSGDNERPVTNDDLRDMKYLECVLKESLRLYPPVPLIARNTEKNTSIGGYSLLKDVAVFISPYALQRKEELYPKAEVFDPNRFTAENSINRHLYSYLPFSAGSRNCIGQRFAMMEMKIIVSNVLRNFSLESLDPRDRVVPSFQLVLRPSVPVRVKLIRRTVNI